MKPQLNEEIKYVIQPGDTIFSIAKKFNTSIEKILSKNPYVNPSNLKINSLLLIPVEIIPGTGLINQKVLNLNNHFRMLWEQHIAWTRMTIMDIVYNLPELEFSIDRLLRNPTDFKLALKPFYGEEASSKFEKLLKEHLTVAADLVKAAKANNNMEFEKLDKKWHNNADDIARLLSSINPYWTFKEWQQMLYQHLELVKLEATYFLTGTYGKNEILFDSMEKQALEMSDYLFKGIIQQFPELFIV